jgi:hypothetical protein
MGAKLKCECLFCDETAVAMFTAPRLKPRLLICEEHLAEQLEWSAPYRKVLGRVSVERIAAP